MYFGLVYEDFEQDYLGNYFAGYIEELEDYVVPVYGVSNDLKTVHEKEDINPIAHFSDDHNYLFIVSQ